MLVTNASELMSSIKELLKAAEIDQLKMQILQIKSDNDCKYLFKLALEPCETL